MWLPYTLVFLLYVSLIDGLRITHRHRGALNHRLPLLNDLNPSALSAPVAPDQWFNQILDHFDGANQITWPQRFLVNDTFWNQANKAGPVFIMLGGEGPISPAYVNGHFIINSYAQEHGALIVALEHRFYGNSVPLNDSSTSNLKYLSSQQALADVANFYSYFNSLYGVPAGTPWISFGGSYSGSLSAWLRGKYPHLIQGAFATSAPVLAQLDFPEYFDVVATSLGPICSNKVRAGYSRVNRLLNSTQGRTQLQTLFNTCSPIITNDDVANFLSALSNPYADVVQYNDDNIGRPIDIPLLCNELLSISDDLDAFVNLNTWYNNRTAGPGLCLEVNYTQSILDLQPTSAGRSWTYQTCTEFGYYQTGEDSYQPFPSNISLEFFLKQCVDLFGVPNFSPRISFTNNYYGAKNISTSNTYFSNGSVDPWHILGITSSQLGPGLGPLTNVVYMTGTAHCADLYPSSPKDLPDLIQNRIQQRIYLTNWLQSNGNNNNSNDSSDSNNNKLTAAVIALSVLLGIAILISILLWCGCLMPQRKNSVNEPLLRDL